MHRPRVRGDGGPRGGVAAATRMLEALVGLGLRTSKVGGYASPLPKAYAGEFGRFAPASAPDETSDSGETKSA